MRTDFKFDIVNIASKITRVNDIALSNCAHRELNFTIQGGGPAHRAAGGGERRARGRVHQRLPVPVGGGRLLAGVQHVRRPRRGQQHVRLGRLRRAAEPGTSAGRYGPLEARRPAGPRGLPACPTTAWRRRRAGGADACRT